MGKYDKIFSSQKSLEEALSSQEAIAAIAVVTAIADSSLDDVDVELIADILWGFEVFDDYSDDDLLETVDKLLAIAEDEGVGALFNTASKSLGEDLVQEAYAAGVSVLVDEEELRIPKGKMALLKKLQQALEIKDEEAEEIIEEVITAFEEAEDEEFLDDDDDGTILNETADDNLEVYESPLGNFIVPIPVDPQHGGRVQSQEGVVGFSDDFGTLLRIDYYPIPDEDEDIGSSKQEEYLRSTLLDKYIPQAIVANLPGASVEYTEYLEDNLEGAYFALVNMPQGSTISKTGNNGTATRLNAYRGLLAFRESDYLYIVSSQRSFFEEESPSSFKAEAEGLKQKILEFVDTIEFN
ncbi:tellurite resistance TerB family protein [Aetokthonos hydrillicola Thurmond2011]|jgi:glycosyltransferase involved in cell wall biosynthesis|uniref:Tellurite resistance TerB family protein n=1 Tax=Aetokthonos hydrillicola Thurmond2011 TaxID=2712845 RepID=A0AAP5I4F2_9CYAN|nr:tellurite resistance TerB family protein [Aetokthonos hydrillicola]MBW4590084.1 tellurite resistance TerB family protein [Aetokthonos hydrillicola CCALA 1050]MDR9894863.1 tellurite resistance TerB family protein [Aetokthonos hydrillicola Thurmond2011]